MISSTSSWQLSCAICPGSSGRLLGLKVALQRRAHLRSRPVKEHSLVGLGQPQGVAGLGRRQAADVAQRDHLALARRKLGDRIEQGPPRLVLAEALIGRVPFDRRARPGAGLLIARRLKPVGVDGRLVAALGAPPARGTRTEARGARVALGCCALLSRMLASQVRSEERPSKRSIPFRAASQVSWTTSSAIALTGHVHQRQPHQERPVLVDERRNASSSPRRRAASSSSSAPGRGASGTSPGEACCCGIAPFCHRRRVATRLTAMPERDRARRRHARLRGAGSGLEGPGIPRWSSSTASGDRRTPGGPSSRPARHAAVGRSPTTSAGRGAARGRRGPYSVELWARTWSGCSTISGSSARSWSATRSAA